MKKLLFSLFLLIGLTHVANGQNVSSQFVTINIGEVSVIQTNGLLTFNINTTTEAGLLEDVTANTTYTVSTNGTNKKITAELDQDLPSGVALKMQMNAPSGATSAGQKTLSSFPTDLVTGISKERGANLDITWVASSTISVEPQSLSRVVIITLTNN